MKFSEKYQLLESVTKGQVRTFLGREVASQTRVVVHIFDCPGNHSGQLAGQWVLQAFRNLAPSPLGQVLEVGSYEDSSYAYIVTKMPDAAALQAWVRAYRVHCGSTEDLSREPKGSDITTGSLDVNDIREALAEAEAGTDPAPEPAKAAGEFTKAFWDLAGKPATQDGSGNSAGAAAPAPPLAPVSDSGSGGLAEETCLRGNAGTLAQTDIGSNRQQAGPSNQGFTEAFVRLGEASLSGSGEKAAGFTPPSSLPAREPLADGPAEKPLVRPILQPSNRPEPGAFTKEFLSVLDGDLKSGDPREPLIQESPKEIPKPRNPGAFTREFLMVTEASVQETREPIPSVTKTPASSPKPMPAENIVPESRREAPSLFQAPSAGWKGATHDVASLGSNKAATGEFTSFFGGPFQEPAKSELPASFPDPLQSTPQNKEVGDFTKMFGSLKNEKEKVEAWPASGGLAQSSVEREMEITPALERAEPGPSSVPGVLSFARKSVPAADPGAMNPQPWVGSALPKPAPLPDNEVFSGGEATLARRSGPAGATQVFVPRGGAPEFSPPVEKSGPGEYTRIISGGPPAQNLPAEAPVVAPGAEARQFSMPAMPQMPGIAAPQMPAMQAPQMPGMAPAQMPPISMPQMSLPQAPPLPKPQVPASGGKASYLPLIIIFNVLFIAAVVIVLYFAFKH